MDLNALLGLIPPPWNMLVIFGLGILTKILHGRLSQPKPAPVDPANPTPAPVDPIPAPSGTPLLDLLLAALRKRLTGSRPVQAVVDEDVDHETVAKLLKAFSPDEKPK